MISLFVNWPLKDYPHIIVCSSHRSSIHISWAIHTFYIFSLKSALFISSVAKISDGWTVLWNNCVLVPVQGTHTFSSYKDWTAFSLLVRDPVVDDWKAVNSSRITAAIRKPLLTLAPAALLWAETRLMDDGLPAFEMTCEGKSEISEKQPLIVSSCVCQILTENERQNATYNIHY